MAFDAFFTHILMHELMHGLGPHDVSVGGRASTVRQELKDTYSTIEEAKADISGLFALQFLVDQGQLPTSSSNRPCTRRSWPRRSARSASASTRPTGAGQAIQLNYLLDQGGFRQECGWHLLGRSGQD